MKRKPYIIFIAATTLMLGCQQNEDYDNREAKNYLGVSIQGVTSSNWGTKTRAVTSNAVPADTLWLNDSIYVEVVAEDIVAEKAPTTRATPVTNAKQIETLSIVMFNTKTTPWSTSAVQESGKSPISAQNTNGSYVIGTPYIWLEEDMNYRTLIAMSPKHTTTGFALSANGQSLDVTVQSDVAKQYDLCVSDITLNKDIQYTIGSNSNQQKFEMTHLMTAVGFEAVGYDLMLTGVKFMGVNSKNTLALHNRTWGSTPSTPTDFEAKITTDQWLDSEHIQTSNPWRNITPNDGYMMMLPQSHTDDIKLEFTFTGRNGQPGGTYTMQLNKIIAAGATTSEWKPGVKITYRLRLKTRPAVQINNITLSDHLAGSTTPVLNIITSTDDDLTFSWTASWLGMYRGTNTTISNPESNGFFTPFATGVNNWANVKFFARNSNSSTVVDRTATVTVTGKKSGVRTFTVTQVKKVSGPQPSEYIKIGNLYWAKGNLVAVGNNGCKIGLAGDYGLYFHFGSLVGWSGGKTGDGTRQGNPELSQRVKPSGYSGNIFWPAGYFSSKSQGMDAGYALPLTDDSSTGIGDPCRYYLGKSWRTPTMTEYVALCNMGSSRTTTYDGANGFWMGMDPHRFDPTTSIFLPSAGYKQKDSSFNEANGNYWSSSTFREKGYLLYHTGNVIMQYMSFERLCGLPVRCVSPI